MVYGNRNYDDALIELRDILQTCGFKVIAGGAFVGEHAFSKTLAKNRPDENDTIVASAFADAISKKLCSENGMSSVMVNGNTPYRKHYMPKNREGIPIDIRKVKPKTNSDFNKCGICVDVCPMGSINFDDPSIVNGVCIKCCACVKKCPTKAKYYDDEDYLRHKYELEIDFAERREPELFL